MNVLMVYAHQETTSFGSAMHNRALSFFEKRGDNVTVSDLYGSGFHAVAAKWDFVTSGGPHENYMMEQKRIASKDDGAGFAEDIKTEIARMRAADLIVFEFPIWWSAPPAIMKGWFDKVFALGVAWDGNHRYDSGLLRGKKALVIACAGDDEKLYSSEGVHKATLTQYLYPLLHGTLAQSGFDVIKPFIAHNLTASGEDERQEILGKLNAYLESFSANPTYLYTHSQADPAKIAS